MDFIETLEAELYWRESELAQLRIILTQNRSNTSRLSVLLRASWAMLYAHYEGYSKFCLTAFFDQLKRTVSECNSLPTATKTFALTKDLAALRSHPAESILSHIEEFLAVKCSEPPNFPEVDAESNLWPNILRGLISNADIDPTWIDSFKFEIRTLVSRRNNISHGDRDLIPDLEYYLNYEKKVLLYMYELAFKVDQRTREAPYNE